MYINAISLKNGLRLAFTTTLPYSVDKLNIVTDLNNGATISFIGAEVVHIGNQDLDKVEDTESKKKKGFSTKVTEQ